MILGCTFKRLHWGSFQGMSNLLQTILAGDSISQEEMILNHSSTWYVICYLGNCHGQQQKSSSLSYLKY